MSRAALCILAIGIDTAGAFQPPGRLTTWRRSTEMRGMSDLYGPPSPPEEDGKEGGDKEPHGTLGDENPKPSSKAPNQRSLPPPQAPNQAPLPPSQALSQEFGIDFSAVAPAPSPSSRLASRGPIMSEAARMLKMEIDSEKSKPRKDYTRLKQLQSQMNAQIASDEERMKAKAELDDKINKLKAELEAAEGIEDYAKCEELAAQLERLEMSSTTSQQLPSGSMRGAQRRQRPTRAANAYGSNSYNGRTSRNYNGDRGNGMNRRRGSNAYEYQAYGSPSADNGLNPYNGDRGNGRRRTPRRYNALGYNALNMGYNNMYNGYNMGYNGPYDMGFNGPYNMGYNGPYEMGYDAYGASAQGYGYGPMYDGYGPSLSNPSYATFGGVFRAGQVGLGGGGGSVYGYGPSSYYPGVGGGVGYGRGQVGPGYDDVSHRGVGRRRARRRNGGSGGGPMGMEGPAMEGPPMEGPPMETATQRAQADLSMMLEQTKDCLRNVESNLFPFAPIKLKDDNHAFELFKQIKTAVSSIQMKIVGGDHEERMRIENIIQSVPPEFQNNGPLALRYIIMASDPNRDDPQKGMWPSILTARDSW